MWAGMLPREQDRPRGGRGVCDHGHFCPSAISILHLSGMTLSDNYLTVCCISGFKATSSSRQNCKEPLLLAKCWWERGTEDGPESSLRKLRIQQGDHELQTVKQGNQTVTAPQDAHGPALHPRGFKKNVEQTTRGVTTDPPAEAISSPRPLPLGQPLHRSLTTCSLVLITSLPPPTVTQSLSKEKMRPDEAPPVPSEPAPSVDLSEVQMWARCYSIK